MDRPDMRDYFRARIDWHVNGLMAGAMSRIPRDVRKVHGDVTDSTITVIMADGTQWKWSGGRYAARKVNGCYAPLMPKPINEADCHACGHGEFSHSYQHTQGTYWCGDCKSTCDLDTGEDAD